MFQFFINHFQGAAGISKTNYIIVLTSYFEVCEYKVKNKHIKNK
jgi:hypothetical protein